MTTTTTQEGYGCSSVKLGSFVGTTKAMTMMTGSQLHSQYGESIGGNMSPRSVLEHRVLSGLAIAIDLEEKQRNKSSLPEQHVVFSRYCRKQNMGATGQEDANSQHNFNLGSFLSRERLTYMIHKERDTASDVPIVGLQMVASLYPLLHLSNPEPKKRHDNLVMGRSVSIERVFMEVMRYDEQQKHPYLLTSAGREREQGDGCDRMIKVSMSGSPPLQNAKDRQPASRKSNESGAYSLNKDSFFGGRSTEESIFYYVNPSSSDASHTTVDDDLSCSPTESFLKICGFCKCLLGVGKDIFMYRGDQAFCSTECRYQQIMIDECMGL